MSSPKTKSGPKVKFNYSEEDMHNAINAVKSGMTAAQASREFQVLKATLSNKLSRKTPEIRRMGPPAVLSDNEEKCLTKVILMRGKLGFAIHPDKVKDTIKKVLTEVPRRNPFTDNRPGDKWMSSFLKRHPEITKRNTEVISKGRAAVTEDTIRDWFNELTEFLTEQNALDVLSRPECIANSDETGVQLCPKSGKVLGPVNEKKFYSIATGNEKKSITVLCTFFADGSFVPPMIVYPYERIPRDIAASIPDSWTMKPIGRSPSGWMISELFYEYMVNIFHPWCVQKQLQFPVIFFVDGHKSHLGLEVSEFCSNNGIILYCLPPNATHIVQPCDVSIFKSLKESWKKVVREHKSESDGSITKVTFAPLFGKAFDQFYKKETVVNGFRACGLFPCDPDAIDYSKCISTRRAAMKESSDSHFDVEDFSSSKKVIEQALGDTTINQFLNIRESNANCTDALYLLWKLCVDCVDGLVEPKIDKPLNTSSIILNFPEDNRVSLLNNHSEQLVKHLEFGLESQNDQSEFSHSNHSELGINGADTISIPLNFDDIETENFSLNEELNQLLSTQVDEEVLQARSDSTPLSQSTKVSEEASRPQSAPDLISVWGKHLSWEASNRSRHSFETSEKKQKLPFAITSPKWQDYYKNLDRQTEEKEKQAGERIVIREEKIKEAEIVKQQKAEIRAEKAKQKKDAGETKKG